MTSRGGSSQKTSGGESSGPPASAELLPVVRKYHIDSTVALVKAYNAVSEQAYADLLFGWLRRYSLGLAQVSSSASDAYLEYAELASMRSRSDEDAHFLKGIVSSLRLRISQDAFYEKNLARALRLVLVRLDRELLKSDPNELALVASKLLLNLELGLNVTKTTFESHIATLVAFQQAFVVAKEFASDRLAEDLERRVQKMLITKLEMMQDSRHYPFRFYSLLIEKAIRRIVADRTATAVDASFRQLSMEIFGMLFVYHETPASGVLDVDVEAAAEGAKFIEETLREEERIAEMSWYEWLQAFNDVGIACFYDPEQPRLFKETLKIMLEIQRRVGEGEEQSALRFGLVNELCHLALSAPAPEVRRDASVELLAIATGLTLNEGWAESPPTIEVLLDALYLMCRRGELWKEAAAAMEMVASFSQPHLADVMRNWRGGESLKQRLEGVRLKRNGDDPHWFFRKIGEAAGLKPTAEEQKADLEELKKTYQTPEFVKASPFSFVTQRHVKDLKFDIRVNAKISAREDVVGPCRGSWRVRKCVRVVDIFEPYDGKKPEKVADQIRSVLLLGNPGVGKTCIAKQIANAWASEGGWFGFEAVYFLPVRLMHEWKFSESSSVKPPCLETAIATFCFSSRSDLEFVHLREQISLKLDSETTLLILDGLHEGDEVGRKIALGARNRKCKLLMLSRPYNLQQERAFVDVELECLGFNDLQITEFINSEVTEETSAAIFEFADGDAMLWEIFRTPFHVLAFCRIWEEKCFKPEKGKDQISLHWLYSELVTALWGVYQKRTGSTFASREDVLVPLEKACYSSMRDIRYAINSVALATDTRWYRVESNYKLDAFEFIISNQEPWYYAHSTLQEWFASFVFSKSSMKPDSSVPQKITFLEKLEAYLHISQQKYEETFELSIRFMAETICQNRESPTETDRIVNSGPKECLGLQHFFLRLKVLDSCLAVLGEADARKIAARKESVRFVDAIVRLLTKYGYETITTKTCMNYLKQIPTIVRYFPRIGGEVKKRLERAGMLFERLSDFFELARYVPSQMQEIVALLQNKTGDDDEDTRALALRYATHMLPESGRFAESLVEIIVSGMKDSSVFVYSVALKQIPFVLSNTLILTEELFGEIERAIDHEEIEIRVVALSLLAQVHATRPSESAGLLPKLMAKIDAEEAPVRKAVVEQALTLLIANTEKFEEYAALLVKGGLDKDATVREVATLQLGRAMILAPQLSETLLQVLLNGVEDAEPIVRAAAMQQAAIILPFQPRRAETLLGILANGAFDEDDAVRNATMKHIPTSLAISERTTKAFVRMLETSCRSENEKMRLTAVEHIASALAAVPNFAGRLIFLMEEGIADSNANVRATVVQQLSRVVTERPQNAKLFLDMLNKAARDEADVVRAAAAAQVFGFLVAKNEIDATLLRVLERAANDHAEDVRKALMAALGKILTLGEWRFQKLSALLIKGTDDADKGVQLAAQNGLAKLSLGQLLTLEWEKHHGALAREISHRFLTQPVILERGLFRPVPKIRAHGMPASLSSWTQSVPLLREVIFRAKESVRAEYPGLLRTVQAPKRNFQLMCKLLGRRGRTCCFSLC